MSDCIQLGETRVTIRPILALAIATGAVLATGCSAPTSKQVADVIYAGGDIVTVNDAQPTVEALAVKDGRILAVGRRSDVEKNGSSWKRVGKS